MRTDDIFARLYGKKIMPLDQFKDELLDYLRQGIRDENAIVFDADAVFTSQATVTAGSINNSIKVAGAFRGVTGTGDTVDIDALDARFQDVRVPPTATTFHVGVEANTGEIGIEVNPRTGEYEYISHKELVGRKGHPTSVVDNGDGTLTININSISESGQSYVGRTCRVWLTARTDGGIGPLASVEANAIETVVVAYSAPNNRITTAGPLGQTPGSASTDVNDYWVMMEGPTIMRSAAEDLRATAGVLFLAAVTGVTAGNPIVTISHADQNILSISISGLIAALATETADRENADDAIIARLDADPAISVGPDSGWAASGWTHNASGEVKSSTNATSWEVNIPIPQGSVVTNISGRVKPNGAGNTVTLACASVKDGVATAVSSGAVSTTGSSYETVTDDDPLSGHVFAADECLIVTYTTSGGGAAERRAATITVNIAPYVPT